MADEIGVLRLIAGELLKKFPCTGLRDGADIFDHFVARHADAVVGNGDGASGFVKVETDFEVGIVAVERTVFDRLEAQLVAGVRRVRDQLAQKYLLVAVQGVNHQV